MRSFSCFSGALLSLSLLPALAASAQTTSSTWVATQQPAAQPTKPAAPLVRYITGRVLSAAGEPLAGVTVTFGLLSGRSQTTISNSNGEVLLAATEPALTVGVSYAGYQEARQQLQGPEPFTFRLEAIPGYKKDLKKRSKAAVKAFRKH
ncbi:Carboxypeptidase regulatory-like domain-containing protein [Hymenobacter daecheongensis DSM 21074]|uniref:Carboxypeptidase regulatory-like domain-containing protein n=1 Tax=Hymenobacter daecheongensis DSM 21074 TaxID=1121955 RepID=A0A1M6EKA3_9BACT|nr:carboxypeptidase-like regulatory domain-containing protein [Hymenobacter daecheongensis]SHI85917.1 Carboxypeptidase regulatory-like domain-containing protein [Hymenobacter daecheongensis DSM 21074]